MVPILLVNPTLLLFFSLHHKISAMGNVASLLLAAPKPAPSGPPQMEDIPDLLITMTTERGEKSAAATKRIYELCDVGHKQNRVPMVCSGKYDVLNPLAQCLTQDSGDGRRLACLALNNLSVPTEN